MTDEKAKLPASVKSRNSFVYRLAMNGKHSADEIVKLANEIEWTEADEPKANVESASS